LDDGRLAIESVVLNLVPFTIDNVIGGVRSAMSIGSLIFTSPEP